MQARAIVILAASLGAVGNASAADFAAKGVQALLNVEYVFDSAGKKQDKYDLHEWSAKRVVRLTVPLTAQAPQSLPSLQPMDNAQVAAVQKQQQLAQSAQQKLAPTMDDVQRIVAQCGENEACIEKAVMQYGFSHPTTEAQKSAGRDIDQIAKQDAPRYQVWRGERQSGTYSIDESSHRIDSDPICMTLPGARCTLDESRKGSGSVPMPPDAQRNPKAANGYAAIEVDQVKNTLQIMLPHPAMPLPYTSVLKSNHPEHKSGANQSLYAFPRLADKPLTVTLRGDLRQQAGEQAFAIAGEGAAGGKLTVRWRLSSL